METDQGVVVAAAALVPGVIPLLEALLLHVYVVQLLLQEQIMLYLLHLVQLVALPLLLSRPRALRRHLRLFSC